MIVIKANKTMIKSDYTGTPDKIIDRNKKVCKGSEIYFNVFDGWVDKPIYKQLSEIDPSQLSQYNQPGYIYVYQPNHVYADDMGIMTYKVIGATYKKADKQVLFIVEDKYTFTSDKRELTAYINIKDGKAVDCGNGFIPTMEAYNKAEIGEEYTGYRRSKWCKLDPNDYSNLFGKVYQDSRL
jgi:hypothetical protein